MYQKWRSYIFSVIIFLVFILIIFLNLLQAPATFPVDSIYTVEKGVGLNTLTNDLLAKQIIKSGFWFKAFSVILGGAKGIIAGDYVFNNEQNVVSIAYRISHGDYRLTPIKITIPEGLNITEISQIISGKFPQITEEAFIKFASSSEGYLFPDTYFFLPNVTAVETVKVMQDNFSNKISSINIDIINFKKPVSDVIKMASIVEEEARTEETRKIVAGILWKRLSLGMPLQVDSSFKYINGKGTKDLTLADLKIDSLYNSYKYKGLPPTPICNPGLDSIIATITPNSTDYLYFLSDIKGDMHYAQTFAEHLRNKELYLD